MCPAFGRLLATLALINVFGGIATDAFWPSILQHQEYIN
jgi:hypothetical protein